MIRTLVIAVIVSSAPVLASPASTRSLPGYEGVQTGDLNRYVDACTDFYEFANGAWRAENPIPAGKPRWSRRVASHDANWHRQQSVLEEVSRKRDWPSGSAEQLLGDHYASCMNVARVDAAGAVPLAPLIAEIDGIRNLADVQRIIRRLHELGVPVAFGVTGAPGYHDPADFVESVVAGGLGLPDRDYYLKTEPRFVETRAKYQAHVAKILILGGMSGAQAALAAGEIFAFEKRLAEVSLDSATAADPAATDHMMSFAQLKALAPHFDWERYFDEAKLPRIELNVAEPKFVEHFDQEIRDAPIETWKAYLRWRMLESAAPWLSQEFVQESFDFRDKYLSKTTEMKPRAQLCVESTDALFSDALAKKYAQAYFPPAAKAKAEEIVGNLRAALKDEVAAVQWMEPETKRRALEKIAATNVQVGYPDKWKDYSGIRIRRDAFWANVAAGRRFNIDEDRRQIGTPTGRDFWLTSPTPSSADGYILVELNKMVLPAGQLQPPFFNLNANDAVNYGAFGAAVAHDLTHFIDTLGAANDIAGNPKNWWTDIDRRQFEQRGQCLVDQFEGYYIEPGVHHDGKRVSGESIADLAGVRIAYLALEKSMQIHPVPAVDGFTPEQQFFISWGQAAGHAMRLEAQRELVSNDPHPVPKFRVIGPLSNSPDFQQAFSCKAAAPMVRPMEKRCAVW